LPQRVSLGGRFEEESLLGALIHSKPFSFAIYFSAVIFGVFSSCFSIRKVTKLLFIYHLVGWEISVFTQEFPITFLDVLAAYQQGFAC
jgi:hypothetical protein